MSVFRTPHSTFLSYASHAVLGARIDSDLCPPSVRREARDAIAEFRAEESEWRFADAAPEAMHQDWEGQLCLGWLGWLAEDPQAAYRGRQLTGDCVSWSKRTMGDQARSNEIRAGAAQGYAARGATAMLYAERGHTNAGASPTRLARALVRDGILLEQIYNGPDGQRLDFTHYDSYYKLGMKSGRTGLPEWLKAQTRGQGPQQLAEIHSDTELLTALWNGCGVGCGSGLGVADVGGKDGVPFLSAVRGSWAHDMAIIGFDARRQYHQDILVIWDQSWGEWNTIDRWPAEYGPKPEGAFVLTLSDTMRHAVLRGETHAVSDSQGFRPQRLEWKTPGSWDR